MLKPRFLFFNIDPHVVQESTGTYLSVTNGFKAWLLQEYAARVHVMKEVTPRMWEVAKMRVFFFSKRLLLAKKIVKKPSPKALSDAVIQRHVFFKNNNRSTMLDKDMKKWLPKRAGTRPAHEA